MILMHINDPFKIPLCRSKDIFCSRSNFMPSLGYVCHQLPFSLTVWQKRDFLIIPSTHTHTQWNVYSVYTANSINRILFIQTIKHSQWNRFSPACRFTFTPQWASNERARREFLMLWRELAHQQLYLFFSSKIPPHFDPELTSEENLIWN